MKISEIKQKKENVLQKMLAEDREKLRQFKFDLSAGKINNVKKIRAVKKDIARILTVLNNK